LTSFFENDNAARTRRETRCRSVLLNVKIRSPRHSHQKKRDFPKKLT